MGEVRTRVVITNAVDDELARRGQVSEDQIRRYEADALVDTDAVRSIIPTHVVERLGLTIRGQQCRQSVPRLNRLRLWC